MQKAEIATIAKLIIATRKKGHAFFLPFEIEEEFRIPKEIIMSSIKILSDMGTFDFTEIPWNPEEDQWSEIAQDGGVRKPRTELEEKHHINDIGIVFMNPAVIDAFNNRTKIPEDVGKKMDMNLLQKIADDPEMIPKELIKKYSKPIEQADGKIKPIMNRDVSWDKIAIKFKNQFEVEIFIGGTLDRAYSYTDLFFSKAGVSDSPPDQQWEFLRIISIIQNLDPAKATVQEMTRLLAVKNPRITAAACVKTKSKLADHLQKLFGKPKEDDPFWDYERNEAYSTRFTLEPDPDMRGDGEIEPTRAVSLGKDGRPYQHKTATKKSYGNDEFYEVEGLEN